MLEIWLHRHPEATWSQLIKTLRAPGIELNDVASKIEEMLVSSTEGSQSVQRFCKDSLALTVASPLTFSKDEDIELAFSRLSSAVTTAIENRHFPIIQRAAIESAKSQRFPKSHEILPMVTAALSFQSLCTMLAQTSYWNFLDTRMLEAMVNASMVPAAQQSLKNFKETFFSMTLQEAAPYFPVIVREKPGHVVIQEILNKDHQKMTIGELHKHRFYLENELFQTGSDTCTICRIVLGSVKIIWHIHVDHVYQAYLSLNKKKSQLPPQAITYLAIPKVVWWLKLPVLWRGQEVHDRMIGPIVKLTRHVRKEPHILHEELKWANLTYDNVDEMVKLLEIDNTIRQYKHKNYLWWYTLHPQFKSEFLFGTRLKSNGKLASVLYSFPICISIGGKVVTALHLRYTGREFLRSEQMHNTVVKEIMRKGNVNGISQGIIVSEEPFIIKPVTVLATYCYWLSSPFRLPLPYNTPKTAGLRRMTSKDVTKAYTLTNQYVLQFEFGQIFQSEEEFSHYFLFPSVPGYIVTYVVEDPATGAITDMFGFNLDYELDKKVATAIAIIPTKTPAKQLVIDLLLCAKQEQAVKVATLQFGLEKDNFDSFVQFGAYYWHFYNYAYPEIDEEKCCLFSFC
ncbi:glycylpeptide N-tetradecanoyltransferase-like isoform X2 [Dysidea avara]